MSADYVGKPITLHALEASQHRTFTQWRDDAEILRGAWQDPPELTTAVATFAEPEDRGTAVLSPLGSVEYVEDLIRPGRIVVVAAEESTGKSYAIDSELGIRVAVAGGSFAGTWPILKFGTVLYLSEMHPDDDYERESTVLASFGLGREDLRGCYYRLALPTAAGGAPALTVAAWRAWVTDWLRDHKAILLIVDTATGATQVDPWGRAIQQVYSDLRAMLAEYPALAVVLVVHCKKPTGRGARRLSDVLGEWGRWNDVTLLMEGDGEEQTKLTLRKRVRRERRIVAIRRGGLLVEPRDAEGSGPKVPQETVLAAVVDKPGSTYVELAAVLGVTRQTVQGYLKSLGTAVSVVPTPARNKPDRVFPVVNAVVRR